MYKNTIIILTIGLFGSLPIYAEVDMQKGVYDAAEEIIEFDKKMNRAIAEHNQINPEDETEAVTIEDFEETEHGYLLQRNIPDTNLTKVDVKLKDGMLTISTTTTEKETITSGTTTGYETTTTSSTTSLFIPNDADESKMEKSYENGILKITFPKKQH
ncbi:hypothetical protein MNB_SV-12-779 [hydrothermal vent metagenome]|uniref:SHSP domain-containing protein n=1 Tax=hydrothermal vent metagenome TaxID=652676 RepID=A0A1W1BDH1_9ZZZZ